MDAATTPQQRSALPVIPLSLALQAGGLLPLVLFTLTALNAQASRELHDLLWMCHIATALVGLGLLLRRSTLLWVGTLWILYGSVWWAIDAYAAQECTALPVAVHILTSFLGVAGTINLARLRAAQTRPSMYRWATLSSLGLQAICHLATPSMANVNFAFEPYYGLGRWFPAASYASFWVALCAVSCASFYVLERTLLHFTRILAAPNTAAQPSTRGTKI